MSAPFDATDTAHVLTELVRIPSLSGDEGRAAAFLRGALESRGFRASIDGAGNVVGELGDGPATIALVGHIDTVPGDLPVEVRDGVLHGRGAVDAKGSLVTLCAAARRAHDEGATARFVVVGCVEEEAPSSRGAHHLVDTWPTPPDALVIGEPSGWDGVTLGYKGILSADVEIDVSGAHGAHEAASAPELACALWTRVEADARAFAGADARLFDRILPRLLSIDCEHDGVRDVAKLRLALRLPESLPPDAAKRWLAERCPGAALTIRGEAPAWSGPRTSPLARALGRAILGNGGKPCFQVKTGTADLNVLAPAWGCPAVAYGPGDAALDHTPEERVDLAEVDRAAEVLSAALAASPLAPDTLTPRRTPRARSPRGSGRTPSHG